MVGLDPTTQTLPHTQNSKQPNEPDHWMVGSSPTMEKFVQTKINLAEKLSTFSDYFSPRTIAQYNDCDVMVVKAKGEFVWHSHEDTDDFFLVLKGSLDIELRDKTITLNPGEMYIVPKGVEHRPVARDEVHLLLIEPSGTPNTGDHATAAIRKLA
jgi:mannose-6-phosphate isomerase-like protein (cupin superfamily)